MTAAVWLMVLVSSLAQVALSHWHRELLYQWQTLDTTHRTLTQDHTRLLLEHSTLTAYGRVDTQARQRLNMTEPTNNRVMTQ